MRKLLSLIALSCAMAMAFGVYAPGARAGALTNSVLALKADQGNLIEKARYRCWWRNGYRRCGYRHGWRHRYYGRHYGYRRHYGYGWRQRQAWRNRNWRQRYYGSEDYPYRRHYYYNSYKRPYYRPNAARPGYCIGLCWW
ncbi:hypothetical protein [Hyphomicrobium sp.]|jgi:hypothetical protein|uniref:hypothetical protein n=1 Tax=Hyphomicrobium sp. TaxID=82 RepID=UPI0035663C11